DGYKVDYVNLDPGVERIPYHPSFDVRELVRVDEVMHRENLGPNGALIKAAEIMENRSREISERINLLNGDFILIDTPGQMEIFLFRDLGPILSNSLIGRKASIFLIDPSFMQRINDFITLRLMSLIVELRLGIPSIEIINKCDLLRGEVLIASDSRIINGLTQELREILEKIEKKKRTIMVSSTKGIGFMDLYKVIGELFCVCGDLT
ncbi:MAG: ATP/GTP-binding protein, partial [Candidatus Methanomethyliaceae archaeon]|nr:ATP/GTP-binding protein [Candidatus Methanomethyliaceae archaeon]